MDKNLTLDNVIGTAKYETSAEKGFNTNTNTETTDELIRKANECLEDIGFKSSFYQKQFEILQNIFLNLFLHH